jgi:hypothetical protein
VPAALAPISFDGGAVDLRPHLCAPASEQALIDGIGQVLEEVSSDAAFPAWHWSHRQAIAVLAADFRRQFLWGLHLSPWTRVELTLAVYEALDLDRDEVLRRGVARLLSFCDRPIGIAWCRVLTDLEPAERSRACEMILESGAYAREPNDEARAALQTLAPA